MTNEEETLLMLAARQGGTCTYKPQSWFEEPVPREDRKAYANALRRLETAGLALATRDRTNRPVDFSLTPKGQDQAGAIARREGIRLPGDLPTGADLLRFLLHRIRVFARQAREYQQRNDKNGFLPTKPDDWSSHHIRQEEEQAPIIEDALSRIEAGTMTNEEAVGVFTELTGHPPNRYKSLPSLTLEEWEELDKRLYGHSG